MFLGQHTIAETNGILQDTDHRFQVVDKAMQDAMVANPTDAAKLKPFWDKLKAKWDSDKFFVKGKMGAIKATLPFGFAAGDDKIPADSEYQTVLGYTEGDTGDPNLHPNDSIRGIELQLQKVIGHPIDVDTGRPSLDPHNVVQQQALLDPDTGLLTNQTVQSLANAGQGVANVGTSIGDHFSNPLDHTIRNVLVVGGIIVVGIFGIQALLPVIVAARAVK